LLQKSIGTDAVQSTTNVNPYQNVPSLTRMKSGVT
jgi:hypothetical protein